MKGTAKRGKNSAEDLELKASLKSSEKERAENMMIMDLVRNDLAKSSIPGSIKVDELFKVKTFRNVHQMVSTVSGKPKDGISVPEILKNAFPMGSMTGAPKIKAMELIEDYENFQRGGFSGSLGFIDPNGDFDFNVIIRSLFFDSDSGKTGYMAGGAITWDSDPELEYQELLLKGSVFKELFVDNS